MNKNIYINICVYTSNSPHLQWLWPPVPSQDWMSAGAAGGEVLGYPELPDEFHGASHRSTLLHSRVSARTGSGGGAAQNGNARSIVIPEVLICFF